MTAFGSQPLGYDLNGNLTNDGSNTYQWNARNHLSSMTGVTNASFTYDGAGRRAGKTINGTTTQFTYDRLNPVQELDGSTNVTANLLTGLNIDEYFSRTDVSGQMSFITDMLGSTLGLTDLSGTLNTQYSYDSFGNVSSSGAQSSNSYQYTGRDNDGNGLDYNRARYYKASLQRFISPDPMDFSGGDENLYSYVLNSPLNFLDLLGLDPLTIDQLTRIIYNETQSMDGPSIDQARVDMGHALVNGSHLRRPPTHAPDTIRGRLTRPQRRILARCGRAARLAIDEDNQHIDPTNGAVHYNERETASRDIWDSDHGGPNERPSQVFGPFDNSYNSLQYIDIYR